jgi:hypothetical protein
MAGDVSGTALQKEQTRRYIDGPKFFSRSPFRSGDFLWASATCLGAILFDWFIVYRYHSKMSESGPLMIVMLTGYFAQIWQVAFSQIRRVRALYREGSLDEVTAGSPLDVALSVAATAINEMFGRCFTIIIFLLALISILLSRAAPR